MVKSEKNNIELDLFTHSNYLPHYCTFNLKGKFILYGKVTNTTELHFDSSDKKIIWVYSTKTKISKWTCEKIYKVPEEFELISISKHDQLYLFSNGNFYMWDMGTEKSARIFINKNEMEENQKEEPQNDDHQKEEQQKKDNQIMVIKILKSSFFYK